MNPSTRPVDTEDLAGERVEQLHTFGLMLPFPLAAVAGGEVHQPVVGEHDVGPDVHAIGGDTVGGHRPITARATRAATGNDHFGGGVDPVALNREATEPDCGRLVRRRVRATPTGRDGVGDVERLRCGRAVHGDRYQSSRRPCCDATAQIEKRSPPATVHEAHKSRARRDHDTSVRQEVEVRRIHETVGNHRAPQRRCKPKRAPPIPSDRINSPVRSRSQVAIEARLRTRRSRTDQ